MYYTDGEINSKKARWKNFEDRERSEEDGIDKKTREKMVNLWKENVSIGEREEEEEKKGDWIVRVLQKKKEERK